MKIYRLVYNPIDVNTYIIASERGKCAIIDCGCYDTFEFTDLKKFLDERSIRPVLVLNTHCHLDHIFGNIFILREYGLRPLFHSDDEYNRLNSVKHAELFGLTMEPPPDPGEFIIDGQIITFDNISIKVLHVPGHSSGGVAFYCQEEKVVFTGDALFAGSIGRTDLQGGNFKTLISSIKNKLFTLPDDTIVYPGHGESTSIGTEKKTNPYFINS